MNPMTQLTPVRRFIQACVTLAAYGQRLLAFITFGLMASVAFAQTATTTTLTIGANSIYQGNSATLSVTVTGSSPTGTVVIRDGTTSLFSLSLSSGTASTSYTFNTLGSRSLTAVYNGNSTNAASTSEPVVVTVNPKFATTTSVVAGPTTAYLGQTVTFTGTVTGGANPTGVIRFYNYGTQVAQGTMNASGVATGSWVINTTYPQMSLSATYAGDVSNATSSSAAIAGTVSLAPVTSQITCPASAPVATAISCTITATSPSIYASVGTATVTENDVNVGTASLTYLSANPTTFRGTVNLPANAAPANLAGNHTLVVKTPANSQTVASTSPATTLVVAPRTTTTALSSSATTVGTTQIVTLTANVNNGLAPTGTVTFRDGSTTLGTAALSGTQATLNASFTDTGSHSLSATYNGDTNNTASTSATITETVVATSPTTTTLTLSAANITAGSDTTLVANIAGSSASGTVVFSEGGIALGTATAVNGQATLVRVFAAAGEHPVVAQYWGDTTNAASTSAPVTLTVTRRATTTTLTSPLTTANQSQPIPLTATLNGVNPGGVVTFREGGTTLGTASVTNGAAVFNASFTVLGAHTITASYGGDANNLDSTSGSLVVQVQPGPVPPSSTVPVVNYEYDAQGNPTKTIQAPGVSGFNLATQASYDSLSRLKDTTDPKNGKTQFGYDGLDRLTRVTDPRNLVTQYPRNGLGDTTQLISPDTGTANHTYDAAGNLKTRTDSRGVLASHSYDELNRLTQTTFSKTGLTSQTFGWTYDQTGAGFSYGIGRLTSTTHPSGSSQYRYDAHGRLLTDVQRVDATAGANPAPIVTTVGYEYDAAGNTTRITYPSGAQVSFGYTNGQLSSVSLARDAGSAATALIDGIEFEPFGGIKRWQWQLAGGATQASERLYDLSARLTRYRLGNVLRDLSYDAADRITGYTHYDATTGVAQTNLNQGFGYDENGRLTSVTTATASWTITYDANGNRTGVALNGSPSVYTTETTSNRLSSITNPARSFGYDPAGNTTSDTAGYTTTYDASGRLQTLTKAGVTTVYAYNGQGQRVRKFASSGAGSTVIFVYGQGGELLGEYTSTGAAIREYVWLGSTPIAMFMPNGSNPPTVFYLHTDHIDTPRIATDTAGNIRWRWMSEPFGTTAPEDNPSNLGALTQPLRMPGQYFDQESGLSDNWHRTYDSTIGRYTTPDPLGLDGGSMSLYAYVGNDPLDYVDPDGLLFESTLGGVRRGMTLDEAARLGSPGNLALAVGTTSAAVCVLTPQGKRLIVNGLMPGIKGETRGNLTNWAKRKVIARAISHSIVNGVKDDAMPPPTVPPLPIAARPAPTVPRTNPLSGPAGVQGCGCQP